MSKSPYKPRARGTLKDATMRLVTACGGFKEASEGTRVSVQSLFRYTDDGDENRDRFMPVDIVRQLEARCGQPIVTAFLAHAAGLGLTGGDNHQSPPEDMGARVSSAAREAADVFAATAAGLADGSLSASEAGAIIGEVDEALEAFGRLRDAAARIVEATDEP